MIGEIVKIFADVGGVVGILLVVICWMVYSNTQITKSLLRTIHLNDERLIDYKKEIYKTGRMLPERRAFGRMQVEEESKRGKDDDA